MTEETFSSFWMQCSNSWIKDGKALNPDGGLIRVNTLCRIRKNCLYDLFNSYKIVRDFTKENYFRDRNKKLSRYKRAAVLSYVVLHSNPLEYLFDLSEGIDPYFLKQNLAFHVGISSIIQSFEEDDVKAISSSGQRIYQFQELGKVDPSSGDDDFLTSVYKDMFFSELYQNYNIMTMANLYGVLTERASILCSSSSGSINTT